MRIYLTYLIECLGKSSMQKMIIAFLSPMKLCPKLHRSLPLNAIRLLLFFLHVCELPFLQTANSLGTMSHFSCIPPWAG